MAGITNLTLEQVRSFYLAQNINRDVPNNRNLITVQRPNNSEPLWCWLDAAINLDPIIQQTINNIVTDGTLVENGLTKTGDTIRLGGPLTQQTDITGDQNHHVNISLTDGSSTGGIFVNNTTWQFGVNDAGAGTSSILQGFNGTFLFTTSGHWGINGASGTAGQRLTSNGLNNPPTWEDATVVNADNGLSLNAPGEVYLGGILLRDTAIEQDIYDFYLRKNESYLATGTNIGNPVIGALEGVHMAVGDDTNLPFVKFFMDESAKTFLVRASDGANIFTDFNSTNQSAVMISRETAVARAYVQTNGSLGEGSGVEIASFNDSNLPLIEDNHSRKQYFTNFTLEELNQTGVVTPFQVRIRFSAATGADFDYIIQGLPVYVDNVDATANGYPIDGVYRDNNGLLRQVF